MALRVWVCVLLCSWGGRSLAPSPSSSSLKDGGASLARDNSLIPWKELNEGSLVESKVEEFRPLLLLSIKGLDLNFPITLPSTDMSANSKRLFYDRIARGKTRWEGIMWCSGKTLQIWLTGIFSPSVRT